MAVTSLSCLIFALTSLATLCSARVLESGGLDGSIRMAQSVGANDPAVLSGDNYGHMTSCLGVKTETFNVTWTPRVLKTDETVLFFFEAVATNQYMQGKACVSVWLDDIPDPIYSNCEVWSCEDFLGLVKSYLPDLKCPIAQGYHLKKVISLKLTPTIPMPEGKYKAKVEVWNEDEKPLLCFEGNVEIFDE